MSNDDIFVSTSRAAGDRAGVFEQDDEVGYFYLYLLSGAKGQKIIDSLRVVSGPADFKEEDVDVRWNKIETCVGLYVCDQLCAVFDVQNSKKYGGDYRKGISTTSIPWEIAATFKN